MAAYMDLCSQYWRLLSGKYGKMGRRKQSAVKYSRRGSRQNKKQLSEARKKRWSAQNDVQSIEEQESDASLPSHDSHDGGVEISGKNDEHQDSSQPGTSCGFKSRKRKASGNSFDTANAVKILRGIDGNCDDTRRGTGPETRGVAHDRPDDLPSTIVDLNEIGKLFRQFHCPECGHKSVFLQTDESKSQGLAIYLKLQCATCDTIIDENFTSAKMEGTCFEVNRRCVVSSLLCGLGPIKFSKFCEYLNIPNLHHSSFQSHCKNIYSQNDNHASRIRQEAVKIVRNAYKELYHPNLCDDDVLDISVSYDGSWLTRGHSSRIGIGCVVDLLTGLCIDWHVMSSYCQKCETTGKKMKAVSEEAFHIWFEDHKEECQQNYAGSAGMMEVEGAVVCWTRSVEVNKMRYTTMLSDGDSKSFNELNRIEPYGQDYPIEKEECINHISKRLGTALRNLVSDCRARGITLGGKGKGRLTQTTIGKLTQYYAKAIRSHNGSIKEMEDAIWASFFHATSTDENPRHERCDKGKHSWCFYQRALAEKKQIPQHSKGLGTFLCKDVAEHVVPVYKKLSDADLLSRCLQGKTQNRNEALHNVVWSRCPKSSFPCRNKVEVAVMISVGEYNSGSSASFEFMKSHGLKVGKYTQKLGAERDHRRSCNLSRVRSDKEKKRREKVRQARIKHQQACERQEGGPSYLAGGF